jgi:formiminotetrahydrofolate cyclodeaminase
MERLTDRSCTSFAQVLASRESVPGGGGAAALAGALGVALCSMVGNFTVGKKKYADVEEDVKAMLAKGEDLRQRLLDLVDADARAFAPLAKAYAIPKDDPTHDAVLEEATLNACKAPVEMVRCCAQAIELLEEMLAKGSVMLVSDVGCGALLCKAAMESAALNVFINTKSLKDRKTAEQMESEMDGLLAEYLPRAAGVAETVNKRVRGER